MDPNHLDPRSAEAMGPGRDESVGYVPKADPTDRGHGARKLVLCFDGTGNKFSGDDSDSNILKIFRMLDREAEDQFHYYQPGIGTYVVSSSLSHSGLRSRISSWYQKAKDSAVGASFDHHVVGGYRFLMRYYNQGDEIYMFGFSRGAYIARFLAEMLDNIGLLSHGNEEMVKFAWKAFAQWQCRSGGASTDGGADDEARELFRFMKGFRETFSRPVGRIRFLGLFDTVNSVPRFETAWMQRSKFPYTARSTAKVIRHAVSIDERRAKFRQDLMYQDRPRHRHGHGGLGEAIEHVHKLGHSSHTLEQRGRHENKLPAGSTRRRLKGDEYGPYRSRSKSRSRQRNAANSDTQSYNSAQCEDDGAQDIDEVWFAGGHGDIGGGWQTLADGKSASHVPLAWMVREAIRAGLPFDPEKLEDMGCLAPGGSTKCRATNDEKPAIPDIHLADDNGPLSPVGPPSPELDRRGTETSFHGLMHQAHTAQLHDSLAYGAGLPWHSVSAWRLMEWLPFRRMDLRGDGSWAPIRWPLPRGEVRDVPDDVRVHGSVIRRLRDDESYRPGNLIVGGGGRGVRRAPKEHGIGDWECVEGEGDPVGEIWVRRKMKEKEEQ